MSPDLKLGVAGFAFTVFCAYLRWVDSQQEKVAKAEKEVCAAADKAEQARLDARFEAQGREFAAIAEAHAKEAARLVESIKTLWREVDKLKDERATYATKADSEKIMIAIESLKATVLATSAAQMESIHSIDKRVAAVEARR